MDTHSPDAAPEPRVEQVPDGIAKHVEPINDNSQEKSRPNRKPGGHFRILASFPGEQSSPTRSPDRQSESMATSISIAAAKSPFTLRVDRTLVGSIPTKRDA